MIGIDKKTTWKSTAQFSSNSTTFFEPEFTPAVENLNQIIEFFDFFIDERIVSTIVECTNKRLNAATDEVTEIEIKGFIGLLLLFGVTKKHDIEVDEMFKVGSVNHMDWAIICMSKNRFKLIASKICFDDFQTRMARVSQNPKLHKINQIFDYFNSKLQNGI